MADAKRWEFEGSQGGVVVFGGECSDQETAMREAAHYAMMYSQDGPMDYVKVWPAGGDADGEQPRKED